MLNQEERAAKFFDAITKDAEERHEEMTRKTRETVESGLEKAKTKAHSQAQAKIERERMLKEQEFNRTVANERTQQRARLTDKRGAITDEVFGDAREKLTAFTESDGYADFLKKSAAGFAAVFLQGDVTVYVRPGDMRFADDIKNAFGRDCKVESSDEITIGGCRAGVAGGSTVADDTLDTRLEAQREWFLENSGMSVIL
jgi:V/A-type H+-transporting ATPase subunit E